MKLRKRDITITVLIALICVAGYVNWNYQKSGQDTAVATNASEAQPTPSPIQNAAEIASNSDAQQGAFSEERIQKEKAKSESIALLNQVLSNENATEEAKKKAQEDVLFLSKSIEMENRAETLLKAKGFSDVNVLIATDVVNVIVKTQGLNQTDVTKIRDIAAEVSGKPYDSIKIVEVKH